MKTRGQFVFFIAGLLAVVAVFWVNRRENAERANNSGRCCPFVSATNVQTVTLSTNPVTDQAEDADARTQTVIAYYFHGAIRCQTCLLIETVARAVVENQFAEEIAANRLIWESVNYDMPENSHFVDEFDLACPSLVLVAVRERKPKQWKLLGDTWQLVNDPTKLNTYVESEVRDFLNGREQPTQPNQSGLLFAPYRH